MSEYILVTLGLDYTERITRVKLFGFRKEKKRIGLRFSFIALGPVFNNNV